MPHQSKPTKNAFPHSCQQPNHTPAINPDPEHLREVLILTQASSPTSAHVSTTLVCSAASNLATSYSWPVLLPHTGCAFNAYIQRQPIGHTGQRPCWQCSSAHLPRTPASKAWRQPKARNLFEQFSHVRSWLIVFQTRSQTGRQGVPLNFICAPFELFKSCQNQKDTILFGSNIFWRVRSKGTKMQSKRYWAENKRSKRDGKAVNKMPVPSPLPEAASAKHPGLRSVRATTARLRLDWTMETRIPENLLVKGSAFCIHPVELFHGPVTRPWDVRLCRRRSAGAGEARSCQEFDGHPSAGKHRQFAEAPVGRRPGFFPHQRHMQAAQSCPSHFFRKLAKRQRIIT